MPKLYAQDLADLNVPWAILPDRLESILATVQKAVDKSEGPEISLHRAEDHPDFTELIIEGSTAIIPIKGVIGKNFERFESFFGAVSTERIRSDLERALANTDIETIILDIDSPGGTVDGTKELADFIFENRDVKKIVAVGNGLIASGAIWIASAASEIFVGPTTMSGSIGVFIMHQDFSKMLNEFGVKVTLIKAGKFKTVGSPFAPLSDSDKKILQARVDELFKMFNEAVAKGRGTDAATVRKEMGEGRLFIGEQAVKVGLVDGVAVLENFEIKKNEEKALKTENPSIFSHLNEPKSKGENVMPDITAEKVKANEPKVYNEIFALGKTEGTKDAEAVAATKLEAAVKESVKTTETSERARATDIMKLAGPNQKDLGIKLFSEGKTVAEATTELLSNANAVNAEALKNFGEGTDGDPGQDDADGANTSVEATSAWEGDKDLQAKYKGDSHAYAGHLKEWNANKDKLQAEFGGNISSFLAFRRHEDKN